MKKALKNHLINLPGWYTQRKIVVIESDDWGSIRMPSVEVYEKLKTYGLKVDRCPYMRYDSMASDEDLNLLFAMLRGFRDFRGNNPVITANCLVANPDFERIRESNYQEYFYETFDVTLSRYPAHKKAFDLWKQGIEERLFHPQLHGREHINLSRWMGDLQKGVEETRFAFDLSMFGISGHITNVKRGSYLAAFDGGNDELRFNRSQIIGEAFNIFERMFGYPSRSFIAPNYVWDDEIEKCLAEQGVQYIQGSTVQRISKNAGATKQIKRHFQGQKNNYGQRYLMRNAHFEPASAPQKNWVNSCLKEIETAFFWKKPVIISTHRVNFVGFIDPANRNTNLLLFKQLLESIIRRWPKVEFMTSDQLGDLMSGQDERRN